jgi:hypothetical protein
MTDTKTDITWYNAKGITLDSLPDLMQVANIRQFGETKQENLCAFLMCEAYENRFDPDHSRALHLAAMIISRVKV